MHDKPQRTVATSSEVTPPDLPMIGASSLRIPRLKTKIQNSIPRQK